MPGLCCAWLRKRLALRELEAAARLGAAVLLVLDRAAVAGQEAALLQRGPEVRLEQGQGAADAVTDRTGLARKAPADHGADDVELAGAVHHAERLVDHHAQHRAREIDQDVAVVDGNLAAARLQPDAGDGVLALAGGIGAALGVDLALALRRGGGSLRRAHGGAEVAQVLQVGDAAGFIAHVTRSACSSGSWRRHPASRAAGRRADARYRRTRAGSSSAGGPGDRAAPCAPPPSRSRA